MSLSALRFAIATLCLFLSAATHATNDMRPIPFILVNQVCLGQDHEYRTSRFAKQLETIDAFPGWSEIATLLPLTQCGKSWPKLSKAFCLSALNIDMSDTAALDTLYSAYAKDIREVQLRVNTLMSKSDGSKPCQ